MYLPRAHTREKRTQYHTCLPVLSVCSPPFTLLCALGLPLGTASLGILALWVAVELYQGEHWQEV